MEVLLSSFHRPLVIACISASALLLAHNVYDFRVTNIIPMLSPWWKPPRFTVRPRRRRHRSGTLGGGFVLRRISWESLLVQNETGRLTGNRAWPFCQVVLGHMQERKPTGVSTGISGLKSGVFGEDPMLIFRGISAKPSSQSRLPQPVQHPIFIPVGTLKPYSAH